MNNHQKELSELENEERKIESILFREKENVIEVDQENEKLRKKIE